MTATHNRQPLERPLAQQTSAARDVVRVIVVAASAVLAVVGSFLGSGAAGGTPIRNAAGGALSSDATLIAPGGPAFSIWTVIYLGLLGYAGWQLLPGQRSDPRQRLLGYPMAISMLLNAAWILSVQVGRLAVSVGIIIALLAVLVVIFRRLCRRAPGSRIEALLLDGTAGLYLGWVCVATAANITASLVAAGFGGFGIPSTVWAILVLGLAGTVGVLVAIRGGGRIAPMLSLAWGLIWVAVARIDGRPESTTTAAVALVAAGVVVVATLTVRLRARFRPRHSADYRVARSSNC
ncbi:tryptophan-rich sensory protein [Microlunatus elymi]|uniref:Tryptophan-rich sensory protein n=1 Tax=Microlunatus elymi TaxID=2596828 RepID=A0A516PW64_9ACTN|nr:TspO/MBR family protein [Microlunatus elymi]QDP95428.1 tryptophan-rich sensory protein [Microlunatus elymi]